MSQMTPKEAIELLKPLVRALARADAARAFRQAACERGVKGEAAMFELGKHYRIRLGNADDWSERLYLVKEFTGSLLKAESVDGDIILNTAAPSFQSATLDPRPVTDNIFIDTYASVPDLKVEADDEASR